MVVLKRKPNSETERQEAYDTVIEVEDRRSYNDSQIEVADNQLYTSRDAFVTTAGAAKSRGEVMPKINKQAKPEPVAKQAVSSKTKVLLAAYIIIAIVLAAVVIGTGIAITEVSNRTNQIETQIQNTNNSIDSQSDTLALVRSNSYMMGEAMQLGMDIVDESEFIEVTMVPTVPTATYTETTNWFDKLCDFFSRAFN